MDDELLFTERSGCSGAAFQGFLCTQTQFPQLVHEIKTMGSVLSYVVVVLSVLSCVAFWICSCKMERDLTKSFMMPVAAPFSILTTIQIIHIYLEASGRDPKDDLILTLNESKIFLNNVGHYTLVYAVAIYLCHAAAAARGGSRALGQVARYYSFSVWYVVVLILFTLLCAAAFPPIPLKIGDVVGILLSVLGVIGYVVVILFWFCAAIVFCACYPTTGSSSEDLIVQNSYDRLGGALIFALPILAGPLLRGVILIPMSPHYRTILKSTFVLSQFLLPLLVFTLALVFLNAYRKAAKYLCLCTCFRLTEDPNRNLPPVRQIHYADAPNPGNFTSMEQRNAAAYGSYPAEYRNENVHM